MWEKLSKLINVKSIVSLLVTGVFVYLSVTGFIKSDQFMTVFTMIMAFYFGIQSMKKE